MEHIHLMNEYHKYKYPGRFKPRFYGYAKIFPYAVV
jgi:hypothetical protein